MDKVKTTLIKIQEDLNLFLNREYMLDIFKEENEIIPLFKKYIKYMYEEKIEQCIRNGNITNKMIPYKLLIDKLFNLQEEVNIDSTIYMSDVAKEIAKAYLTELHDKDKTSWMYLSSYGGDLF